MITPQAPLASGFGPTTTARDVLAGVRLDGRVTIITGGHAGIGLETTRALTEAGATVVVGARSVDKARAALAGVSRVEIEPIELSSPASIDAFAARFVASGRPLHLLVNNAGIMATPRERDARGHELQLATNHLGHFQLTARLWPTLLRAKGARVVALTSRGHARAAFDFDDPDFERRDYDRMIAYGQSKTANALFAVALDARGADRGVRAFSVHPGAILTELTRSLSDDEVRSLVERARAAGSFKTTEQGAATSVWCGTSALLEGKGGVYCEDCDVAEAVPAESTGARGVRPWATDPAAAERLWSLSETWTGATLAT